MPSFIKAVIAGLLLITSVATSAQLKNGEYHASLNGVRHWYRIAGAEHRTTPLVVVHGGPGGNSYNFEKSIGPRLERFATVVYYDQRGSGRSEDPKNETDYTIDLLVSDLDALRKTLGVQKITPLGFSFGGELALEYAVRHQNRIERLILQSAVNGDHARMARYQAYGFALRASGERRAKLEMLAVEPVTSVSDRFDQVWGGSSAKDADHLLFQDQAIAALNRRMWKENGLKSTMKMAKVVFSAPPRSPSLVSELHKIKVPTLVMVGLYDRNVGVDMNREIAEAIPRSQLVIFEKSAHLPDMEEPEKYAETVRGFLVTP